MKLLFSDQDKLHHEILVFLENCVCLELWLQRIKSGSNCCVSDPLLSPHLASFGTPAEHWVWHALELGQAVSRNPRPSPPVWSRVRGQQALLSSLFWFANLFCQVAFLLINPNSDSYWWRGWRFRESVFVACPENPWPGLYCGRVPLERNHHKPPAFIVEWKSCC